MPTYRTPDVYVEEISVFPPSVAEVETAIPAFIGHTERARKIVDADLAGQYAGYDGPWPPFNDERRHQYTFTVYALDVESLGLSDGFGAAQALKAMEGHIVAQDSITCWYAINPRAR